ncbi:hypothetical protein B0H17DRAFT_1268915 [Mycena rosella]|uniref:Uncharacterized protein n=1 Tax=Mycena rosella TaxID=1033263 RepID=A0AAD7CM98_MYCRO|nr:hypothetical protein B0H17DRAFT_1268915 [Mycena rosella]
MLHDAAQAHYCLGVKYQAAQASDTKLNFGEVRHVYLLGLVTCPSALLLPPVEKSEGFKSPERAADCRRFLGPIKTKGALNIHDEVPYISTAASTMNSAVSRSLPALRREQCITAPRDATGRSMHLHDPPFLELPSTAPRNLAVASATLTICTAASRLQLALAAPPNSRSNRAELGAFGKEFRIHTGLGYASEPGVSRARDAVRAKMPTRSENDPAQDPRHWQMPQSKTHLDSVAVNGATISESQRASGVPK